MAISQRPAAVADHPLAPLSLDEVQAFIDKTYTEDGDGIPSPFMR